MGSFLKKFAVPVSAVAIVVLTVLALGIAVTGMGDGDATTTASSPTSTTTSPLAGLPGSVQVGSPGEEVVTICEIPSSEQEPTLVGAHNIGPADVDIVVEVELSDGAGSTVVGTAVFSDLRPTETRYLVPTWTGDITAIAFCRVTAVESDRSIARVDN